MIKRKKEFTVSTYMEYLADICDVHKMDDMSHDHALMLASILLRKASERERFGIMTQSFNDEIMLDIADLMKFMAESNQDEMAIRSDLFHKIIMGILKSLSPTIKTLFFINEKVNPQKGDKDVEQTTH